MVIGFVDWAASSLWRGRANRKEERRNEALRARGVLAPARVVTAVTRASRSSVDGAFIKIDYTVDVYPPNGQAFRAQFEHWSSRRGYTAVRGEIVGEAGKQIWVTFDPADASDMIFEYDEEERQAQAREADLDARRTQFNALAQPLEVLRTTGVPAEALIVGVEDLDLPYPRRQSVGLYVHVDVATPQGGTYRAVIPALINVATFAKYSQGRRVFVRVDPAAPQRVVLDSERNRALPN